MGVSERINVIHLNVKLTYLNIKNRGGGTKDILWRQPT